MNEIESDAVITTDWSRWIRRNNSDCQCLSLAQCEPPSSMCSSSTQAGNFRSATLSSSLLWIGSLQQVALFPLVHQEGIASSASTRPQAVSSVYLLAKEITTWVGKVAWACKAENRICSLSYATKVRTRINNGDDDYNKKNFSEKASKGCFAFYNAPLATHYLSNIRPEPARGLISFWYQTWGLISFWYQTWGLISFWYQTCDGSGFEFVCTNYVQVTTTSNSATIIQYNGWSFTFVPIHTGCWSIWLNKADRIVHGACLWVKKPAVYLFIFYLCVMIFFRNFVWCSDSHLFLFCKAKYLVYNIIVFQNVSNGKERDKIQN